MSKKYIDINEILETSLINEDMYLYDDLMKGVPNFDKSPGARKVYGRKNYVIYQVKRGYIVHNIALNFNEAHTHVRSFHKARSFIDLCIRKKIPNEPVKWEIESLLRISDDIKYKDKLIKLIGGDVNEYE